jgi:hypothetical protein
MTFCGAGWKEEALTFLAAWAASGLLVASRRGGLLGYCPNALADLVLDALHLTRRYSRCSVLCLSKVNTVAQN